MKSIKTSSPPKLAALFASVALLGLVSQSALAAQQGTPSGTNINNKATLTYYISTVLQPVIESKPGGNTVAGVGAGLPTTVLVDKKVDLTLTDPTAGTAHATVPGQLGSSGLNAITYTLTNMGNDTQDFLLSASQPVGGALYGVTDTYDSTNCTAFFDTNTNGKYDAGDLLYVDELASGASRIVTVTCDTPTTLANPAVVNGAGSIVTFTAQAAAGGGLGVQGAALVNAAGSADNPLQVDIVFADGAGLYADDIVHDGKFTARDVYQVGTATITVNKTATLLCDPISLAVTPHSIPGATIQYVVTITNAALSGSALLSSIGDVIDANSSIDPNLVKVAAGDCLNPENAAGNGFKVNVTGSTRPGVYPKYFTTVADADAVGIAVDNVTITAAINAALPAEGTYAAGELKGGETVTLTYNVKIK